MREYTKADYLTNDYSTRFLIRVHPETMALVLNGRQNNAAGGGLSDLLSIVSSVSRKSRRALARRVLIQEAGTDPQSGLRPLRVWLPWLRPEGFADFATGGTGTYRGLSVEVIGYQDEKLL